jgi:SsrA-binding protein
MKTVAINRKARFEYFIEDTFECGIKLVGSEVKSVRKGDVNIGEAYVVIRANNVFLLNAHIAPYDKGSHFNTDSKRNRQLLLNKQEIDKLRGKVEQKGYTIVPLKIYFKQALVKIEIGLAKGKDLIDKRKTIKERDLKRETERELTKIK